VKTPAASADGGQDVLLVVPPFAHVAFPTLGPSLLVAGCRRLGLRARIVYANLLLAARIGHEPYSAVSLSPREALLGERLFGHHAFPNRCPASRDPARARRTPPADLGLTGDPVPQLPELDQERVEECEAALGPFLDEVVALLLSMSPNIVGFSSSYQQTLCSVALARRLKQARPDLVTVLGGANAVEPMGTALADLSDALDHVFTGPADRAFPLMCHAYVELGVTFPKRVIHCKPLDELDTAEVPDYSDYFEQLDSLVASDGLPPSLPECLHFEASRGCWWGAVSHCTFCGLNASEMRYRAKSAGRLIEEMRTLVDNYGISRLYATDNLISPVFRREVVPKLAGSDLGLDIFCEVRPDLDSEELGLFAAAGVSLLQAGIESLSSHVLRLLAKGTTGPRNLIFLRDCASWRIRLAWNLLLGVPGETREDYEAMLSLLPLIEHLEPPGMWGRIRIDRFSRYHEDPLAFGMADLRASPAHYDVFPPHARIDDLAYHFVAYYSTGLLEDQDLQRRFRRALDRWSDAWRVRSGRPRLQALLLADGLVLIEDTRACARERYFVATAREVAVLRRLARPGARSRLSNGDLPLLDELVRRLLVVECEGRFLSLVTEPRRRQKELRLPTLPS
jgi:ribosomal peptide maturation radical SAM protein 1